MARWLRWITLALLLACMVGAFAYGHGIPFSEQKPILDALVTVSAIVFGVMGAWIALIYPKGLSGIFAKKTADGSQYERVRKLFSPMKYATLIIAYSLLLQVGVPIAKQISLIVEHKELARAISLSVLVGLIGLQLWTLLLTLMPLDEAEEQLEVNEAAEDSLERRTGRVQKRTRDDASNKD